MSTAPTVKTVPDLVLLAVALPTITSSVTNPLRESSVLHEAGKAVPVLKNVDISLSLQCSGHAVLLQCEEEPSDSTFNEFHGGNAPVWENIVPPLGNDNDSCGGNDGPARRDMTVMVKWIVEYALAGGPQWLAAQSVVADVLLPLVFLSIDMKAMVRDIATSAVVAAERSRIGTAELDDLLDAQDGSNHCFTPAGVAQQTQFHTTEENTYLPGGSLLSSLERTNRAVLGAMGQTVPSRHHSVSSRLTRLSLGRSVAFPKQKVSGGTFSTSSSDSSLQL